jgi:hypothetical protein
MKNPIKAIKKKLLAFRAQHITIYCRDGKYYWTIKSCGFDSFDEAVNDANLFCNGEKHQIIE